MAAAAGSGADSKRGLLGEGEAAFDFGSVEGTIREITGAKDVVELLRGGGEDDVIALIDDCGGTLLAPILPALRGVICSVGNPGTHLGIVAREYQVPCAFLNPDPSVASGSKVILSAVGMTARLTAGSG